MASVSNQPQCRVCYKLLPESWAGFDLCVWCAYEQEAQQASRPSFRPPSYSSPLLALDRESDAD